MAAAHAWNVHEQTAGNDLSSSGFESRAFKTQKNRVLRITKNYKPLAGENFYSAQYPQCRRETPEKKRPCLSEAKGGCFLSCSRKADLADPVCRRLLRLRRMDEEAQSPPGHLELQ